MKITDEAVQAAINAWFEETREHVKSVEPLPEQARRMRLALEASLPYLHPVDVAAVHSSSLIELLHDMRFYLENMGSTDDTDADLIERIMTHVDHIRALSAEPAQGNRKYKLGDRLTKTKGSKWTGHVVGFYSTALTPVGYAIESETETGSVQIYPETALTAAPTSEAGR